MIRIMKQAFAKDLHSKLCFQMEPMEWLLTVNKNLFWIFEFSNFRILKFEFSNLNLNFRISNSNFEFSNFRILNFEFWILNFEFRISNFKIWILNFKFRILNFEFSKICNGSFLFFRTFWRRYGNLSTFCGMGWSSQTKGTN